MPKQNDFIPTRDAAHEFSERSIAHSREFMSHPEAARALGILAPRLIEALDHLYVPETTVDADGRLVVELPALDDTRAIPVISAPAETVVRLTRTGTFVPDELQHDAIRRAVSEIVYDEAGSQLVGSVIDEMNHFGESVSRSEFTFSRMGGLAVSALAIYQEGFATQSSPVITLNMHGPDEAQANPYVLLHEALHAADITNEPVLNLRLDSLYRHLLRYELRGYHVSAKVIELQESMPGLFRQYNLSYSEIARIKRIEAARLKYNDFLGIDDFEPNPKIETSLRRHGTRIVAKSNEFEK